jgi:type IV secretory pathway VirB10-like protein
LSSQILTDQQDEADMSDGINGRIGEEGQAPLLVIADEQDEAAPALIVVEESAPELPKPAVEALEVAKPEIEEAKAPAPKAARALVVEPVPAPAPAAPAPAAPIAQVEEAAAAPSAPLPQPQQEAAPVAATVEEPQMKKHKPSAMRHVPMIAVSLAVFTSGLSMVGLLVASRTVAETKLVLQEVQTHQHKMKKLDTLIEQVAALRRREQIALARLQLINAGKPVTAEQLRATADGLQLAMTKYQLGTGNSTLQNIRDGQYELAERVGTMYRKVERMDDQLSKMSVSSSPKAKSAGGREPTS